MKFLFWGKRKRPESEAVIDIGKLKEINERNHNLKENPLQASSSAPGPASSEDDFGFLGALANAASSNTALPIASSSSNIDIEKIERLDRRIDRLIERFELIERKIERIERRVDLKY